MTNSRCYNNTLILYMVLSISYEFIRQVIIVDVVYNPLVQYIPNSANLVLQSARSDYVEDLHVWNTLLLILYMQLNKPYYIILYVLQAVRNHIHSLASYLTDINNRMYYKCSS